MRARKDVVVLCVGLSKGCPACAPTWRALVRVCAKVPGTTPLEVHHDLHAGEPWAERLLDQLPWLGWPVLGVWPADRVTFDSAGNPLVKGKPTATGLGLSEAGMLAMITK